MLFSLGILKPDCLERKLVKVVFTFVEDLGFNVIAKKVVMLTDADIEVIYETSIGRDYYNDMRVFLTSGPCMAYIVKGDTNTIFEFNNVVGPRDPMDATQATLRGRFGESIRRNVTHSTLNEITFWREVKLFFSQEELEELRIVR